MKKWLTPLALTLTLILSACGGGSTANNASNTSNEPAASTAPSASPSASPAASGTITYESESGPVEVPANPQRIVALTNAPNVLSMNATIVGVDQWTAKNPLFTEKLSGVEQVSEDDLEKIIELEPDLIIAGTEMKNLKKLGEIAPTVAFTWGKLDYLAQQVAIGKLLNKEAEAQAWVDDFQKRAEEAGTQIKAKIGEDATVSVLEYDAKSFYVFGNNWARGTEVLYQAMGLKMPEKVTKDALGPGYYTLSNEAVADYAGDYVVLSQTKGVVNPIFETETWKNIPAVKNERIITIDTEASSYSDPITLDHLLKVFTDGFLAMK
ncbi:iron-hydroxamate ABC transporter substrate-binding protein [Paenibacillus pasadenensis]|uniref:iron-hydroxamate ABC transporter substrate-binding protein n=1 Tax=Paenibacillus pasadenensis TaxID=217090 RepID=UPI00203A95D8|nr:iron-hydroxamate ABC transporter substrate-binding protein [Paenibacillus pasadenensis]MCM3747812.1 iron-hydroxamate ABC transporter substrate-binding protein [Paenibacillus pasadenensis]